MISSRTRACHEFADKAVLLTCNEALRLGWHIKDEVPGSNYPSDVSDEEWAFCAPYLTLMKEDAPQREYPLRAMFSAVRYMVRAGCPWRMIPNYPPPWCSVHQQTQRWIKAGCLETLAHDLRKVLRLLAEKQGSLPP
jgi:transposase